jgi:hypothetical protein
MHCDRCEMPLNPKEAKTLDGKTFHPECLWAYKQIKKEKV